MPLRHALRSLRRTPVFATAAALTLALGIGSVAAAFTIAYGVRGDNVITVIAIDEAGNRSIAGTTRLFIPG